MLPAKYKWLAKMTETKMVLAALAEYGTLEFTGKANNPKIVSWAKEVGGSVKDVYKADDIPWCGLLMAVAAKRAGKEIPKSPLWALSWSNFGKQVDSPMYGDVLVFTRNGGGHVAIYIGEDKDAYHCLGGNQSDKVSITRISKKRLYVARRPIYINQPKSVRKIYISPSGELSNNEQ